MSTSLVWPVLGVAGLAFGVWGWFLGKSFQRRQDKDERYEAIQTKSMALAWRISLGFMLVLMVVLIGGAPLAPLSLLLSVFLAHMISWVFAFAYYKSRH